MALLDGVLALPAVVSPFFLAPVKICLITHYMHYKASPKFSLSASKSKLSLPVWASQNQGKKYLSVNIYADWQEFGKELDLLNRYMFVNWKAGASITLALGLLLHKYLLSPQQDYRDIV